MNEWVWSICGMILTGETEVLGEKHYTAWVVDEWMSTEHLWNDTDRRNWGTGRKTLYSVGGWWMNEYGTLVEWYWQGKLKCWEKNIILVQRRWYMNEWVWSFGGMILTYLTNTRTITILTWTGPGSNSGIRDMTPATNHMSLATASTVTLCTIRTWIRPAADASSQNQCLNYASNTIVIRDFSKIFLILLFLKIIVSSSGSVSKALYVYRECRHTGKKCRVGQAAVLWTQI